jgi:WD40 repeat protein
MPARLLVVVAVVCGTAGAVPATAAGAVPGARLWIARHVWDLDWDDARALAVSPDGTRLFVTGFVTKGVGGYGSIGTVAYDAATGDELWASLYDIPGRGGGGEDIEVSPDGARVFVTGYIGGAHGYDFATVAYDTSTGAELWTRRFDGMDGDDVARAVGVSPDGSSVFVTGRSLRASDGDSQYVTLSYDASTGVKRWTRRYHAPGADDAPGRTGAAAEDLEVSADGSAVFVTGSSFEGVSSKRDYATLAYATATGAEFWTSRYDGPGHRGDVASDLAVSPDGSTVFVTGRSPSGTRRRVDYATVSLDAATGAERWASRYDGPDNGLAHSGDEARALVVSPDGSSVFVTGASVGATTDEHYATVAYDAGSGAQRWVARCCGSSYADASGIAVSPDGSQVFVTGTTGTWIYTTVAYGTAVGDELWVRRHGGPLAANRAHGVAVDPAGSRVFVTGGSVGRARDSSYDYLTVAYATG